MSYAPVFANKQWVLAHGVLSTAILITDNCSVDTALGRDRGEQFKPKGRLLFAPVSAIKTADLPLKTFGRCALPEWKGKWEAGAVELRRCFMVDARDIATNQGQRKASLAPEVAADLEIKWSAFASRRGPLVTNRNCEKLAEILGRQRGKPEPATAERDAARAVAETLTYAWHLGGPALEAVSDAHADDEDGAAETTELVEVLQNLADAASKALSTLQPLADPNGAT